MGYGEADKTNTRKLSQLSLVCLLTSRSLTLQAMPGGREGSWSNIWEGTEWPSASTCLSVPLSQKQVERRKKRGELSGVKASGRRLAPASRKGAKGKAVSPAGSGG